MHKPLLTIVLLTAILIVVPAVLFFWDNSDLKWREKTETESIQAKVVSVETFYRNTAWYEYTVADKSYQTGRAGLAGMVRPGDTAIFHYNPSDPLQGTLGDYEPTIPYSMLLAFPLITLTILWGYYLLLRPRHSLPKLARVK